MPFAEALAPFFDPADFGIEAAYLPLGSTDDPVPVNGIFDKAYVDPLGVVEGAAPVFTCAAASVPAVKHGDALTIDGTTYTVRGVEPDGTGVVLLRLEEDD